MEKLLQPLIEIGDGIRAPFFREIGVVGSKVPVPTQLNP